MGYCMDQNSAEFFIAAKDVEAAMLAVRALDGAEEANHAGGASYKDGKCFARYYSWVAQGFGQKTTLVDMVNAWRWMMHQNDAGDIVDISFNGDKYGDDDILFNTLAPFVRSGSFISMRGEDGALWRWYFIDGECVAQEGKISFE